MSRSDKGRQEPRKVKPVTVSIEGVISGHANLFNKLCEEKQLVDGDDACSVFEWMIWKEACEVFGDAKANKILVNYYAGLD